MSQHQEPMQAKKYPIRQSAAFAGGTFLTALPFEIFGHFGPTGLLVGGLASYVAFRHGPEIYEQISAQVREMFPSLSSEEDEEAGHPKEGSAEEGFNVNPPEKQAPKEEGGTWVPPQFSLDDVIGIVQAFNKRGCVYFGDSEEGAIALSLSEMYHVIDVSSSGKGKSNRFRLAMMQMVNTCETYYINPLAANVKAVKDGRKIEVWKPIYDRLANKHPVKEGGDILTLMKQLTDEIRQRNEQEEEGDFSWMDHPIFLFVDELPEVAERAPEAIKLLDKIGRQGRQFGVFCWIASQTALVSEIGQSTAAQANYKTRIYGGGDKTSCNRMMKGGIPDDAERTLQANGAGLTIMLADGMEHRSFVRAPLVTNEALFAYLGLPPFKMEDWIKGSKTTSISTSQVSGVTTSMSTSPTASTPKTTEVAGNGSTSARKWTEVDAPLPELSELEMQIGDLFFLKRQKKSKIIELLYPNAKGGNPNIKASEEIDEAIRRYAEVMRHRAIQMMQAEREVN